MKLPQIRRATLPLLTVSLLALSACGGGGDSISDAIDDATKGIWLDSYSGSCGGALKTIDVTQKSGDTVTMSIRVNTTGDVEPLSGEWFTEGDGWKTVLDTSAAPTLTNTGDGTGRFFSTKVTVKKTGDMVFRLAVKDKKGDVRFEDRCKVHVNIN